MFLNFDHVFYDKLRDLPFAVLTNEHGSTINIVLSYDVAKHILLFNEKDKNAVNDAIQLFMVDLLLYSDASLLKLEVNNEFDGQLSGYAVVKFADDNRKVYYLSADQIVLLSVLFESSINVHDEFIMDYLPVENSVIATTDVYHYERVDSNLTN